MAPLFEWCVFSSRLTFLVEVEAEVEEVEVVEKKIVGFVLEYLCSFVFCSLSANWMLYGVNTLVIQTSPN